MCEKILIAMVGGTTGNQLSGLLNSCLPLAATPRALEAIEAVGEDCLVDFLDAITPPKAGGLWVLECTVGADDEGVEGWRIESHGWRPPSEGEFRALLQRQMMRTRKEISDPPGGTGRWVFLGALV